MNQLFIFILGLVLGAVVIFLFLRKKPAQNYNAGEQEKIPKKADENKTGNLKNFNEGREKEREINKQKILDFLKGAREGITNNDIEKLLSVSDATATRYLEALEREGQIAQIGETGKAVSYKIK